MRSRAGIAAILVVGGLGVVARPAAAQLSVDREKVLYVDMKVATVGPFVSTPQATSGVVWRRKITHSTVVGAVRLHVEVRQGRPAADWRIRIRDLAGDEVETWTGGTAPLTSASSFWTGEVRGRGAEIELVSDTDATGLEIAVDQYAFRVISGVPQSITGLDQRIPIRQAPQDVRALAPPIARLLFIRDGEQFVCTGFLVTPTLLLTNEHCLGTEPAALSAIVEFGFDTVDAVPTTFRVSKLEAASIPLDYAIVRLRQAPNGFGRVKLAAGPATEDEALVVIEHPAGEFKQASIEDCKVKSVSKPGTGGGPTDFGHLCDTLGGSSGSPVLDRQTGGLVGLHHLGIPAGAVDPVNQAVHIGQVLADVKTRVPALHAEITGQNQ
jgi:V8-like Glu-specific endopeptidase